MNRLNIESVGFVAESGIGFPGATLGTLNLTNSTFETDVALELTNDPESTDQLLVKATGNQFECENAMLAIYEIESSAFQSQWPQGVLAGLPIIWQGTDNRIPEDAVVLFWEEDEERVIQRENWYKWIRTERTSVTH